MNTLLSEAAALHKKGGIDAVNRWLKETYLDQNDYLSALEQLEVSGYWEIKWHTSSSSGERDEGLVWEFFG